MELPTTYTEKFQPAAASKTGEPRSNRDALINDFLLKLNPGRVKAGYTEYTPARLAKLLKDAGYREQDYHGLYKSCERARSFGSLFTYLTKRKA